MTFTYAYKRWYIMRDNKWALLEKGTRPSTYVRERGRWTRDY